MKFLGLERGHVLSIFFILHLQPPDGRQSPKHFKWKAGSNDTSFQRAQNYLPNDNGFRHLNPVVLALMKNNSY